MYKINKFIITYLKKLDFTNFLIWYQPVTPEKKKLKKKKEFHIHFVPSNMCSND